MTVTNTALKLLAWAYGESLLKPDAFHPPAGANQQPPVFDPPLTMAGLAALRQKQIRFVGIDETAQSITVYLHKATPSDRMMRDLPATADGHALRFRQGNPETVSPGAVSEATSTCALHFKNNAHYYTCGSSVSVGNARLAGTLGCLLRDPITGEMFGLSNNHVTGGCNYAPIGLPIVVPGIMDVTPDNPLPMTIGTHARQLPMLMGDPSQVNSALNRDAAVFKLINTDALSSMQQNHYDTPSAHLPLAVGMEVQKVGRTSELTHGIVQAQVLGPLAIGYAAPHYNFNGSIFFDPLFVVHGIGDRFSDGGDSGSLLTHVDAAGKRYAVGIVIGGCADNSAPGQKLSLVAPIEPILAEFALELVSGHNV